MSLLIKALKYRKKFLKEHIIGSCLGLFKKVISYLNSKNKKNILTKTSAKSRISDAVNNKIPIHVPNYSEIIEKTLNELSELPLEQYSSYKRLNKIISDNFNFIKSAILIFSPEKNKFIFISGINLDDVTKLRLSFDINYKNIFKKMIKDKSFILYPDNNIYKSSNDIFSENDINDSDFQLFVPFIFSGHVIGIFLGLKLKLNINLNNKLITGLKKVCNSSGSLLYNLIQNNNE